MMQKGDKHHEQQQQQRRMSYKSYYVDNWSTNSRPSKAFEKV